MSKIVFKQSYKSRSKTSTPGLNVRHLNYIATRPGAIYNPGCGFGLWGQLPGDGAIRLQNDLEYSKRVVRDASKFHTLYRAIISVGKDDAQEKGLYDRARWEQLVNDHIGTIAKEMDIKTENLCWCASMHYAKNHPHVHILYWDNGTDPRPEGFAKEQFIQKTEHIRADFSREIHREELLEVQHDQRQQLKEMRTFIQAMCREANPEQALDLNRLYNGSNLDGLASHMYELVKDVPSSGSLRYAYLPPDYKAKVDALVTACLEVPDLAKELDRYDTFTQQISELYSNSDTAATENLAKAREKLYKELGNQVMDAIRELRLQIQLDQPFSPLEVQLLLQTAVNEVVPSLKSYQYLKELLPRERIPVKLMERQIPGYHEQLNNVVRDVLMDARIRLRLQTYALSMVLPENWEEPENSQHTVCGKKLSEDEYAEYEKIYRDTKSELRREITSLLRQDVGWLDETLHSNTALMLCGMMRLLSQSAYQRQASAAQAMQDRKLRSRDRSREARKDYHATQQAPGEWGNEF